MITVEEVLAFINECVKISITYKEKGYRVECLLTENSGWSSPSCNIYIIDSHLPVTEIETKVTYRNETVFLSDSPDHLETIKDAIRESHQTILRGKEEKLVEEVRNQIKALKKGVTDDNIRRS